MKGHCTFFLTIVMLLGVLTIYGIFHVLLVGHLPVVCWIAYVLVFLVLFLSTIALVFTRVEGLSAPDDNYLDNDRLCITCFSQWSICMMYTIGLSVVLSMTFFLIGWILGIVFLAQQEYGELLVWNYLYLFYILALLAAFLNKGYRKYKEFREMYPSLF